jgi:hypothetical protein
MKAGNRADSLTLSQFNTAMAGRSPQLSVAAEFTAKEGPRFFGTSGNLDFTYLPKHSLVRQTIEAAPRMKPWHGWCAEMSAIARAEQAGIRVYSGTIKQLRHRIEEGIPLGGSMGHNTWIKPCPSCQPVLKKLQINN